MHTDRPSAPAVPRAEREERHILDYLRVVYKRRWIAVPAFLLVSVPATVNTFRATPIYEARTQILIERDAPAVASLNEMFQQPGGWYEDDFYQTQYRLLQSRSLARRAVVQLKLAERRAATPSPAPGFSFSLGGLIAAARGGIARITGRAAPAAGPAHPDETDLEGQAVDAFLGALSVIPVRNSRLVEVRFRSTDPKLAADMANGLAQAFIEQGLETKYDTSKQATDWLGERLAEQRQKVEESEARLQRYKEEHGAVALDDRQNIVVQKLADLNAAVTRAKMERIEKEALYRQLQSVQGTSAVDSFPAVLANDYIQKLKGELGDLQRQQAQLAERYGVDHPEMKRVRSSIQSAEAKLNAEIAKVVESVRSEFLTAQAREQSLTQALNSQKAEALGLNRTSVEYSVLEREAESDRNLYESLLKRTKETDLSGERRASNSRVVDPAEVPKVPVLPARQRDVMLGAFGGLLLALALVMLFEYMDNRVKTPHELKAHLGLPFLGMIPVAPKKEGPLLVTNGVPGDFTESIKAIRTNLLFSSADLGARCLLVTSAGPGEGKSVVASNLAIALAQTGQRVLLIDGDMRRPRVHEQFDLTLEPGLSNLLVGGNKPSETIRLSSVPGLVLLPAGHIPPNPIELLGSQRFKECMAALSMNLDWIVIDSPPVLVVSDASVLAHSVSSVILVVAADQTSRHAAKEASEQLRTVNAKIAGTILNRVDLHRHPYYYTQYSRKQYTRYYQTAPPDRARRTPDPKAVAGAGRQMDLR